MPLELVGLTVRVCGGSAVLSWHWCGPHWTGVHVTGPHSIGWRHTPCWCCHPWAAGACMSHLLELCSGLGGMGLKILSCSAAMLGAIRRNAMSCWGFSASIQAIAWERASSCACIIAHTWKFFTTEQKSCDPHFGFIVSFHGLVSAERSMKLLILACNTRKGISSVAFANGLEHPHTWGRHWQLCLGIFPKPLDSVLMESTQMRTQAASVVQLKPLPTLWK